MQKLVAKLALDSNLDQIEIYESFYGTYYEVRSSLYDSYLCSTSNLKLALKYAMKFSEKRFHYNGALNEYYDKTYGGIFK